MSWLIGYASLMASLYIMLIFHPIENNTIQVICCVILLTVYPILLVIAENCEDKMEKRITALEKKLDNIKKGDEV